jgi:thiosulfate/3-mercaptopyruvate sulfurtransferase
VRTVLVDCRPRAAFEAGHVPGAVHLDPERELSGPADDPRHGGRHPLPPPERLAETLGERGIDRDAFVLAYDDGTGWAARCWWLLRHLGHDAAATLELRAYAGPLQSLEARVSPEGHPSRRPFATHVRADDVIEMHELRARLDDPSLVLLDARAPERWRGDVEPLDPVAGRIPGARNAFFEAPLPDGLPADAEVAVYCGSGVTACVVVQRLLLAGRARVRMYPGSFSEWCRNPDNPIERGSP